jgi:hypothetical protein
MEAGGCEGRKLMAPRIPGLGKAVTQQHRRPFALLGNVQMNAVRLNCSMADIQTHWRLGKFVAK